MVWVRRLSVLMECGPRYEESVVQSDTCWEECDLMVLKLFLGGMFLRMPAGECLVPFMQDP